MILKAWSHKILSGILLISTLHATAGSSATAFQVDRLDLDRDAPILLSNKKNKKQKQQQQKRSSGSGGGQSQPRQKSPQQLFQGGSGGGSSGGQRSGSKESQRSGGQSSSQRENSNRTNQSSPKSSGQPKGSYPLSSPYKKNTPAKSESKPSSPGQKQTNQTDGLKRNDTKLRAAPNTQNSKKSITNQNTYTKKKNVNVKQEVNVKNKTNVYVRNKNVVNVKRRVSPVAIRRGSWCRRGWVAARPWRYGWYGGWRSSAVVYPGWGWWAASAPTWGALTLSPTIIIQQSVDSAVASNSRYMDVPNTDFRIFHASINPIGPEEIEFDFEIDGDTYRAKADCKNGLLNDETPSALDEAELMHTACTIAFSSLSDDQATAPFYTLTAHSLLSPSPE
jgi:hypothetical protein